MSAQVQVRAPDTKPISGPCRRAAWRRKWERFMTRLETGAMPPCGWGGVTLMMIFRKRDARISAAAWSGSTAGEKHPAELVFDSLHLGLHVTGELRLPLGIHPAVDRRDAESAGDAPVREQDRGAHAPGAGEDPARIEGVAALARGGDVLPD